MEARKSLRWTVIWYFILMWSSGLTDGSEQKPITQSAKKPNIIFILTDDQDLHMDSLSYMPFLKEHVADHGTALQRHYCTVALCCPSRVSMWTGKAAHNTNVTDLHPPWGGYPKFVSRGFNDAYLPIWLQDAGYNTYYVGKLFNAQSTSNYDKPHAAGWTGSDFLLDPYTYEYYNATFQRNHDPPVSYQGRYSTDVIAEKALGFLDDALKVDRPFFLTIAPTAPHSNVHIKDDTAEQSMARPARRHEHLFKDAKVPRTPNFNPDRPGGASWILTLPLQNQSNLDYNDEWYRNRLRALQAVDEMIDGIVNRLEKAGMLENSYLFFSTDNGYSIGQHRRQPGKQCAFEEDVNIPLIVRGPGIPKGYRTEIVTSHIDLAPTFLSLAGVSEAEMTKYELDGSVIPLHALDSVLSEQPWPQEHVNVEMWGIIMSEGRYGYILYPNHTYKALRVIGNGYDLLYTVWCSNEHELYDMTKDQWQMDNIYHAGSRSFNIATPAAGLSSQSPYAPSLTSTGQVLSITNVSTTISRLVSRLDALLLVLKTCKKDECRFPWSALHPAGGVRSLRDALDSRFDEFYRTRPKVQYERCERGYFPASEGSMWDDGMSFRAMEHEVWTGP
ncbi:uncharacterized protein Z519_00676 [Cladophialophora bantiana CBS 173.52]|uniref:Arylsulfatase n=1 Tax=Cladophialophora bantiana (strain ATCC 10958 / CBS 173.52 / CDC B-1940 / NIH 8579) TaxID=1442370 RepID=A0A0D2I006_CLAB1|nr:uncharacterized protein Z519_00676 [Cladophialophora bantiana CBS 173.52]KIW99013.1 hypothetical protein Z519_00676 [Cladophialophora bantiana CBS 173.52]